MSNWLKTLSLTVNCPYCGTGYVFKKEENKKAWENSGSKEPLHSACKIAKKKEKKKFKQES